MRKNLCAFMAVVILAGTFAGCATVQKKFTRKKKEPEHIPAAIYIEQGPYQKKFSNVYYYQTHFTLWKSWHDELLKNLGHNTKKIERASDEAYGHITEFVKYLDEESAARIKPHLDVMKHWADKIKAGDYSKLDEDSMRADLEKVRREVGKNFYYAKIKPHVLPDKVDLGGAAPTTASP